MTVHFNSTTGKLMFPWEFVGVSGKNYITNRGKIVPRSALTPRFVKGVDPLHRKAGGTPALDLDFTSNKSLAGTVSGKNLVTFTRASSATYVDGDGLIRTTSSGAPRFDHDPATGESLGLLIEEARTNDISNNFTIGSPASTASKSKDTSITNPDGTTGAIKVTANPNNGQHSIIATTSIESTNHSFSAFVKKGNHRYVGLCVGGTSNNIHCLFDFDTKTIIDDGSKGSGNFFSAGFEEYANGWFRLHVVGSSGGTRLRVFLVRDDQQDGVQHWTASGNEFMYVWGPQKETGDFPTSYIPTSGSAVTRAADIAEITGTNFSSFYNQSEGTVFVETSTPLETTTIDVQISDGTNDNKYELRSAGDSLTEAKPSIRKSSVTRFGTAVTAGSGSFRKLVLGYEKGNNAFACDGNISTTTDDFNLPTVNKLRIGDEYVNIGRGIGHIKRLAYFPTRLPDATLQNITT